MNIESKWLLTDEEKDRFVKTLLNKSKAGVIWSGRK